MLFHMKRLKKTIQCSVVVAVTGPIGSIAMAVGGVAKRAGLPFWGTVVVLYVALSLVGGAAMAAFRRN
jgi:hypothetical protein